jgi:hypothetical protein
LPLPDGEEPVLKINILEPQRRELAVRRMPVWRKVMVIA